MALADLTPTPLALSDADLEIVARVAERLLAGRPLNRAGGLPHRRRVGVGLEFYDYREYVAGDALRHIDWRASARSGRLQIKRFHEESASQWSVCLDRSASMATNGAEKWRLGAEIAAAFAYVLLALGGRVGLTVFSDGIDALCPLGRGQRHYARVLETIGAHRAGPAGGESRLAACVPAIRKDTGLIVVSDFLERDAMRPALASLARLSGELHAVRIASEHDYSQLPAGPLTLRDAETGREREVVADEALEASAQGAWEAQSAEWVEACASLSIRASTAWTGEGWKEALLAHLAKIGQGHRIGQDHHVGRSHA